MGRGGNRQISRIHGPRRGDPVGIDLHHDHLLVRLGADLAVGGHRHRRPPQRRAGFGTWPVGTEQPAPGRDRVRPPDRLPKIKQTSLGDVLHASGHIRRVRKYYPDAHLTLLTSVGAADLFHYNPHIDELISFDRYWIKYQWFRHPIMCLRHGLEIMGKVRQRNYDLVIDLQGRWKTVLFLWGARAKRRVVKGRWWFASRFHQPELHAIEELDGKELDGRSLRVNKSVKKEA